MSDLFALIVEDETDLAIIFSKALQEAGFETQIVRAGDTALMWLSSTAPQIVVLDLHLPRVSGKEVLEQIRADERLTENSERAPPILLGGNGWPAPGSDDIQLN